MKINSLEDESDIATAAARELCKSFIELENYSVESAFRDRFIQRRHGSNGQRSLLDYEKAHQKMVICV